MNRKTNRFRKKGVYNKKVRKPGINHKTHCKINKQIDKFKINNNVSKNVQFFE